MDFSDVHGMVRRIPSNSVPGTSTVGARLLIRNCLLADSWTINFGQVVCPTSVRQLEREWIVPRTAIGTASPVSMWPASD